MGLPCSLCHLDGLEWCLKFDSRHTAPLLPPKPEPQSPWKQSPDFQEVMSRGFPGGLYLSLSWRPGFSSRSYPIWFLWVTGIPLDTASLWPAVCCSHPPRARAAFWGSPDPSQGLGVRHLQTEHTMSPHAIKAKIEF